MDGYQFIQAVRNLPDHKGKHTPALALTAGFTPISRTVWLSLNYITDAFPSVCVFLGYRIARRNRRYLSLLQHEFDTVGDIFARA